MRSEHRMPLFSAEALAILDRQEYDPTAKGVYELMSGALMWSDEFPRGTADWNVIAPHCLYRFLLAYRASITLGQEHTDIRPLWEQVLEFAPNWPGLREERRGARAKRRLLAALRRQEKCFEELERRFEEERTQGNTATEPGESL